MMTTETVKVPKLKVGDYITILHVNKYDQEDDRLSVARVVKDGRFFVTVRFLYQNGEDWSSNSFDTQIDKREYQVYAGAQWDAVAAVAAAVTAARDAYEERSRAKHAAIRDFGDQWDREHPTSEYPRASTFVTKLLS